MRVTQDFPGFVPDTILCSPLARSMQTAALAFPTHFSSFSGSPSGARVATSPLLADCVSAWNSVEAATLDEVIDANPQLECFRAAPRTSR